jgi:hypothetical protein
LSYITKAIIETHQYREIRATTDVGLVRVDQDLQQLVFMIVTIYKERFARGLPSEKGQGMGRRSQSNPIRLTVLPRLNFGGRALEVLEGEGVEVESGTECKLLANRSSRQTLGKTYFCLFS